MGRTSRAKKPATARINVCVTPDEAVLFADEALKAGFRRPDSTGASGAWLRSLGLAAIEATKA